MTIMYYWSVAVFLMFFLPCGMVAQPVLSANITGVIDDNVTNTSLRISDKITTLSAEIGYGKEFGNTYGEIAYAPVLNYYSALTERTFQMHTATASLVHLYDEAGHAALSADIAYGIRKGREEFSLYDYGLFSFTLSGRYAFSALLLGKAGYSFSATKFAELDLFDHHEHYGFVQATISLPTKTTLIVETGLGTKRYLNSQSSPEAATPPGTGHMHNWQNPAYPVAASPGATQIGGILRIGQSVAAGTGLSLTARYLRILEQEPLYLLRADGDQSVEEIVNDQYGYEGPGGELRLTQLLPASMTLIVAVGREQRRYDGRPVYSSSGEVLANMRADVLTTATVRVEKRFPTLGFSVGISYLRTVSASNDPLYHFSNSVLGLWMSTL